MFLLGAQMEVKTMKSKTGYKNISNLHSLIRFFYYASIVFAASGLIALVFIFSIQDSAISFERGIRGWIYSVNMPLGIGSAFFMISGEIPKNILQFVPIHMINIRAAIVVDFLISHIVPFIIVIMGLREIGNLTSDMLNKKSPFQTKYLKSLRKISYIVLLYSTLGNTLLCILISIFVTDIFLVTVVFSWIGVLIGVLGYIFSDITEYGLFLQDEYDTTL